MTQTTPTHLDLFDNLYITLKRERVFQTNPYGPPGWRWQYNLYSGNEIVQTFDRLEEAKEYALTPRLYPICKRSNIESLPTKT